MLIVHKDIVYMVIIVGRNQTPKLLEAITEHGGRVINSIYGKGSVKASYLQSVLGLVPEENKTVITCLLVKENSDAMFDMLIDKFDFNKPNTGIAFTIPVEELSH